MLLVMLVRCVVCWCFWWLMVGVGGIGAEAAVVMPVSCFCHLLLVCDLDRCRRGGGGGGRECCFS